VIGTIKNNLLYEFGDRYVSIFHGVFTVIGAIRKGSFVALVIYERVWGILE
jgi:hypothetical protein